MVLLIFDSTFYQPLNSSFCPHDIEGEKTKQNKKMSGELLALQPRGKSKHNLALTDSGVE